MHDYERFTSDSHLPRNGVSPGTCVPNASHWERGERGERAENPLHTMSRVELTTVADTFCLRSNDTAAAPLLVIHPDFSAPSSGWQSRTEAVTILKPNGQEFETTAQLNLSHFNIRDPEVPLDRRWRVTVSLPNRTREDVPVGSKILVSPETRDAIFQTNGASSGTAVGNEWDEGISP